MRAARALVGATGLVAALTLASRLFGLARKLAQSWALSDSPIAVAYDTANTVPNVLFEVAAGGALAGAVIPLLSRMIAKGQARDAEQAASALMTWILAVGVPLAAVVAILAGPLTHALLPGLDAGVAMLAANLLRIFAIQIPLYGLSVVATGILHSHGRFLLPALSPLLSSVSVTAMFVVYSLISNPFDAPGSLSVSGMALLGWGTTAGVAVFALPQLAVASRYLRLRPTFAFPPGAGRTTARLGLAGLAALLAQQGAIIAIMVTANGLGDVGTYAAFNYAYAIFMVPYAVLAVPVATVTFPQISKASGEHLRQLVARSTAIVTAMGMSGAALLIVLAQPAKIVLDLGRDINGLDAALQAMSVGLVGFSLLYHGARVLYARGQARRVILANSLGWGSVIVGLAGAAVVGVGGRWGTLVGIGAAMSLGLSVGGGAMLVLIGRSLGREALRGIAKLALVLLPTLAASGAVAYVCVGLILGVSDSIAGAFAAAVVGAGVVVGSAVATIFLTDRQALASLTR
ncbi:murein biosynthesis integral membrane protein MurJ [Trueperella pecoris]|uniref:Virulence factor MviN n=1 Tax=Trueperella pecoris TaxID=2733571 RepID=A0A7M1QSC9_9ACTO|nr:lipid II flippase MurJ [Trueperella pecoris]QOQ38753.1 virulence factor MviN [Trueperella pecoris]QOR44753.1 virulence factor MviN [Trueperella pecoris]